MSFLHASILCCAAICHWALPQTIQATFWQYYELTLNTELKKLYVRGDECATATEYKIMSLLLSRPGRIFPAEEIYERVWEQDSYSVENTVMIHINRLRKKIELNPKKPEYLKVVWGIGYKIEK